MRETTGPENSSGMGSIGPASNPSPGFTLSILGSYYIYRTFLQDQHHLNVPRSEFIHIFASSEAELSPASPHNVCHPHVLSF